MIRQHRGALPPFTRRPETISPSRKLARTGYEKSAPATVPSQPRSIGKSHDVQCRSAAASGKATGRRAEEGEMVARVTTAIRSEQVTASAPARRRRTSRARRAMTKPSVSNWMDCLGATAACRTGAYNRCGLRCSRCTVRRHRRAALCRNLWSSGCLSRARCCLATDAAAVLAPPMKTTTRRSLRHAWRVMTWPLAGHIVFALGIGFACGMVATRYPEVMAPPYAAIFGTVVLYPVMVAMWWHLHSPGGRRR